MDFWNIFENPTFMFVFHEIVCILGALYYLPYIFTRLREKKEGKNLPVPHCIKGTAGHSIVDEVFNAYLNVIDTYADAYEVYPMTEINPIKVEKPTFGSTELVEYLSDMVNDGDEIEFVGLCTDICVISKALMAKAGFYDIYIMNEGEKSKAYKQQFDEEYANYATGIECIENPTTSNIPAGIYNINGMRINSLQRGLIIVQMGDGTIKKVMVK